MRPEMGCCHGFKELAGIDLPFPLFYNCINGKNRDAGMIKKHIKFALYFLGPLIFFFNASVIKAEVSLLEKGIIEYRSENFEEALALLLKAKEQQPDSSIAAFYLGLTHKQMGSYAEAVRSFKDAISLSPPVNDAYVELVDVLYNLNELKEAKSWVEKAEKAGVKLGQVAFLKGLILVKQGDNSEAVAAFKRAKEADPSLSQPADFQIAMAYAKQMRLKEAIDSLKAVIAIAPQSEIASFAGEYEKMLVRNLESYRPWKFSAGLSYQYDDNVVLKPSTAIPGIEITGEKDSAIITIFNAGYAPLPSGPLFINAQLSLASNEYFRNKSHNLLSGLIIAAPGYNFSNGAFTLPISYNYAWLQEKPYMTVISARPTVNFMIFENHIVQASAGYSKRQMIQPSLDPNEDRNGNIFSASAGYVYPFAGGKGMFNARYELSLDNTAGSNWTNTGNRISAGILLPLKDKLNLTLSGDAFVQYYANIHTVFQKNRKDMAYTGSAALTYAAFKGLNLNVQYNSGKTVSNVSVYEYNRNTYTAGIEFIF